MKKVKQHFLIRWKKIIKTEKYHKDSVNLIKNIKYKKYMITQSIDWTINIFEINNNFKLLNIINEKIQK